MLSSSTLAQTADALEDAAGATVSANATEPGYWLRIRSAAEALASATTSANDNIAGNMLRTAVALESLSETSGAEENANYSGRLKRTVDALEELAGEVTAGSLGHRLLIGAQNAVFSSGPSIDADTTMETDTGWTYTSGGGTASMSISSGTMNGVGGSAANGTFYQAAMSGVAESDVIRLSYAITAVVTQGPRFILGGGSLAQGGSTVGNHTTDVTCGATDTILTILPPTFAGRSWSIDNLGAAFAS